MSEGQTGFSKLGFAKTFVFPGLMVFLIPALALAFFLHAQSQFNKQARESVIKEIQGDGNLTPAEKERGIAFFNEHPFSELIKDDQFAANLDGTLVFNFATFRWMIRLSAWSIIGGAAVFLLAGLCVLLSLRSHRAQYISLSLGWQVLRAFCAVQVLIQGILLVALSFWVTALWAHAYYPKLIFVAGAMALLAVGALTAAIFKRTKLDHDAQGRVIERAEDPALWTELERICGQVGTAPPDQVVVGIDDNFFVTETPITVAGKTYHGRTLYVSLSLLKQMNGAEAEAVLAHEMAHFSGEDTIYSKKIAPLLVRYGHYLDALEKGAAKPIYYFMNCFRALFELSLSKFGRQREFRADRIAMEVTSPGDFVVGLLRIVAYSHFRNNVQQDLFEKERAMENANICERIETGFQTFTESFLTSKDVGNLHSTHPFDRHPSIVQRFEAAGMPYDPELFQPLLTQPGNGEWYDKIAGAEQFERDEWNDFERQFRDAHEQSLPYRFLPENEEEMAIVVKAFPEVQIDGAKGSVVLNFEAIHYAGWKFPVLWREITHCQLDKNDWLQIKYERDGKHSVSIKMKDFKDMRQTALDTVGRYYCRYMAAVAYQAQKAALAAATGGTSHDAPKEAESESPEVK